MENKTIKEMLQENIEDILKYKEQGLRLEDIGIIYGVKGQAVGRVLKAIGKPARAIMTDEIELKIVEEYQNGVNINILAKNYRFSSGTISDVLKKHKIHIKTPEEINRKYTLDEHYFDVIDTQEKAYILGLLYADGNISKNTIQIRLQERDKHILEDINKLLGSNRELRFIDYHNKYTSHGLNRQDQYGLEIVNKYMSTRLKELGVVERKSLILEYPDWLPDELFKHFIRGYMDGDGTIYNTRYTTSFVSTHKFCESVQDKIFKLLHIKSGIYQDKRKSHCYSLNIKNYKDSKAFLDYIYQDATIYLQRKYDIYNEKYINNSYVA